MGAIDDAMNASRGEADDHRQRAEARANQVRDQAVKDAEPMVAEFLQKVAACGIEPNIRVPNAVEQTWEPAPMHMFGRGYNLVKEAELSSAATMCWNLRPEEPLSPSKAYPAGLRSYLLSVDGSHLVAKQSDRKRGRRRKPDELIRTVAWHSEAPLASDLVYSAGGPDDDDHVLLFQAMVNFFLPKE